MGLTALLIQHRRATYDLLAGSIVVMEPTAPRAVPSSRRPSQPIIAPAAAAPPVPAGPGASGVAPIASPNAQPATEDLDSDSDPDDELD